jgi:hypothetical protein
MHCLRQVGQPGQIIVLDLDQRIVDAERSVIPFHVYAGLDLPTPLWAGEMHLEA